MIVDISLNNAVGDGNLSFKPAIAVVSGNAIENRDVGEFADLVAIVADDIGIVTDCPVAVEESILSFQAGSTVRHEDRAAIFSALIVQQPRTDYLYRSIVLIKYAAVSRGAIPLEYNSVKEGVL